MIEEHSGQTSSEEEKTQKLGVDSDGSNCQPKKKEGVEEDCFAESSRKETTGRDLPSL